MKDIKDICFIIQARLSSERVPRKMVKPFAGTTITDLSIKKVLESKVIPKENFYLSVYEKELIEIGKKYDVNIFHRSEASARSEGTPITEIYEWWDRLPFKYAVLINACAPFLTTETIDDFVESYRKTSSDGMFGVMEKKNYFWNSEGKLITKWPENQACMNTKFVEVTHEGAHCLYAGRLDLIGKGIWMGDIQKPGDIELYSMKEYECLDIDYEWQFNMCEAIYKGEKQ